MCIITIMVFRTGNGWLGTPMGGWELKSSPLLLVMQLRSYAVTHMVLYVQLYPNKNWFLGIALSGSHMNSITVLGGVLMDL